MTGRLAQLVEDNRAASSSVAVALVVTIAVGALLVAFLFPIAIGEFEDPEERSITQNTTSTVNVSPLLDATLDSTTDGASATYTLSDNSSSESNSINVGEEATYSLDGGSVTVNVSSANSDSATATFTFPSDFGWGGGASSLWAVIPIVMILGPFLFFVRRATMDM